MDHNQMTNFWEDILLASKNMYLLEPSFHKVYLPYSIRKKQIDSGLTVEFCGSNQGKMYFNSYHGPINNDTVFNYYIIDESDYSISHIVVPRTEMLAFVANNKQYLCDNGFLRSAQCSSTSPQRVQCVNMNGNAQAQTYINNYMQVGTSYLDDFMYSNKSSDIFITGLYFFIPVLLFIIGMKVFRKGLFK